MTEEKFTMADADDDGKIKKEAGSTMASVAKRESPKLWQAFEQVCQDRGVDPGHVLGGKALRALEDAGYAEDLARKDIDLSILGRSEMKIEDVQYVMNLADELGINEEQEDPIMELVDQRIRSAGSTPLSEFTQGEERSQEVDRRLAQQLERFDKRLSKIEQAAVDEPVETSGDGERQEIDDLFDEGEVQEGGSSEPSDGHDVTEVDDEEVEVREVGEDEQEGRNISVDVSGEQESDFISSEQGVEEQ